MSNGHNPDIIIPQDEGKSSWRIKPLEELNETNDSLFEKLPKRSIIDIMQFVNHQTHFSEAFHAIVPKGAKHERSPQYIIATILANALRLSVPAMGNISDLNVHSLLSVEKACIRMETLTTALNIIYQETVKLPIFKAWNINDIPHGSLDGMKISVQLPHNKAQASSKYFGLGTGVSSYNLILNHFPLAGKLIEVNEYEGHFAFELTQFQHKPDNFIKQLSVDKHGVNSLNFLLFYLVDMDFAPRLPKPHL